MITAHQSQHIYSLVSEVIESLDDVALDELLQGCQDDIDMVIHELYEHTSDVVLPSGGFKAPVKLYDFVPKLTETFEHVMRVESLAYFIQSVLPQVEINWHHLEWCSIVQSYQRTCFIASRGLGKSYFFTYALPLWRMYRYEKPDLLTPVRRSIDYCGEGIIFTYEQDLGKDFLRKIKEEVENNQDLAPRLFPNNREGKWGEADIICKNGARLFIKSYGSAARGRHPGYIVIDDFLIDNVLYSKDQRDKITEYVFSVIDNMPPKYGPITIVGCVGLNTVVLTENGLRRISKLSPTENFDEKSIHDISLKIYGRDGFKEATKYFVNGEVDTNILKLERGYELECSHIHPVLCMGTDGIPFWKKSSEVEIGDYVALKAGAGFGNATKIDLRPLKEAFLSYDSRNNPLELPDFLNEDLAYLIGLWVSEGSYSDGRLNISNYDQEIRDWLLITQPFGLRFKETFQDGLPHNVRCGSKKFGDLLIFLGSIIGKSYEKTVPTKIFESDSETIISFLKGLYDGDGCVSSDPNIQVRLGSTSLQLIKDVQMLLLHLGILATISDKGIGKASKKVLKAKVERNMYQLVCSGESAYKFCEIVGFRLSRKNNVIKTAKKWVLNDSKIPYQKPVIDGIRSETPRRKRGKVCTKPPTNTSLSFNSNSTIYKLKTCLDWFVSCGAKGRYTEQLRKNIDESFIWLRVFEVQKSHAKTVDFVVPDGNSFISNGIVSHNTPFHSNDLYGVLKTPPKSYQWKVFEYPAILPNGTILWPNRMGWKEIMNKKQSQPEIAFSREILCKPINSSSTIFPYETMCKAFINMDSYTLVTNVVSFPKKFSRVVIGCDLAISQNVGADFTCFLTWGIDEEENWWLLNMYHEKGKPYRDQLSVLKTLNSDFRPDVIFMEANQFQQVAVELAVEQGLPVIAHVTTEAKNNFKNGLPSLSLLFQNEKIKLPRGNQESINKTDLMLSQFSSIAFTDHGLKGVGEHDDIPMAAYISKQAVDYGTSNQIKLHV